MLKQKIFNKICRDIRNLKIQSATTLAKKAFYAYKLIPTEQSKRKLLSLRPTEPMLYNVFRKYSSFSYSELIDKLKKDQEKVNQEVFKIIKKNSIIFTHCHSTSVINALIHSKRSGKDFVVYHTETRPKYQGRKTAVDLKKAGIKSVMVIDSAMLTITKQKKVNLVILGADAITNEGVLNKIGSGLYSEIARNYKIPLYIVSNSLKYSDKKIEIENRPPQEVWDNKEIKIENPAFELIPKENITYLISEIGTLNFNEFLEKIKN